MPSISAVPKPALLEQHVAKERKRRLRVLWLILAALAVVVTIVIVLVQIQHKAKTVQTQTVRAQQSEQDIRERFSGLAAYIQQQCADKKLSGGVCSQGAVAAEEIQKSADRNENNGVDQASVNAYVTSYLLRHPPREGQGPSASMVATAVNEYLTQNPPKPGQSATSAQISDATNSYLASNAALFRGSSGAKGDQGAKGDVGTKGDPGVAGQQGAKGDTGNQGVQGDQGVPGTPGQDGVSIVDVDFVRTADGCVASITLSNGQQKTHPVNPQVCPPETTEPPATSTEEPGS